VALSLTSTAFQQGETIPTEYTADGRDVSPPLKWSDPPGGTKSFALVCDDPDAPRETFTHWVVGNLPAEVRELSEGATQTALPRGAMQGVNSFKRTGYGGPSPPPGKSHRYRFHLYALDAALPLTEGVSAADLKSAMQGHVLAETELMGLYGR